MVGFVYCCQGLGDPEVAWKVIKIKRDGHWVGQFITVIQRKGPERALKRFYVGSSLSKT